MRYSDFFDPATWEKYPSRDRRAIMHSLDRAEQRDVRVQLGAALEGGTSEPDGFFCRVIDELEGSWLSENMTSLHEALLEVGSLLERGGWFLNVVGLDPHWRETPQSFNSCYGFHPEFDGAVHMLEPRSVRDNRRAESKALVP